ncbi:unnamed protein product [Adineta ricciae]|uniref:FLYWCH-type domain-containing protein n=1 Tax=Adineta ricciae TaxID=249248 RepID=A0A815SDX0_ADIRI|nr:unnamed protein product [Adineta ricciae]
MATTNNISSIDIHNLSFIKSNKNEPLLVLNNYVYKRNKTTAKRKYWVCVIRGCQVYVHTTLSNEYAGGGTDLHSHAPNPELVQVKKVRQKMKERALNEVTLIGMIYEEEIAKSSMTRSALAIFPTNSEIYQGVAKARRKAAPELPQSCFFTIPDIYKSTIDGKRFLLYDGSPIRRERILLFGNDDQLDLLFDSHTVFMDGTFSKAPHNFCQIYIIHAVNFDICLTCVYGLLMIKKSIVYKQIFVELKQIASQRGKSFSPASIITDFEPAVLPVLKS